MRALPAGAETVALYVADLAKAAKPATIDLRLAAISAAHRAAQLPQRPYELTEDRKRALIWRR